MSNGGPAFPQVTNAQYGYTGLSLRDYFAAAALPLAATAGLNDTPRPQGMTAGQHVAQIAYAIADRMLAERAKAKP